jgi:hypothetical protein
VGTSRSAIWDEANVALGKGTADHVGFVGIVTVELRGPDGELKGFFEGHNLVTQVGDQYYGERAAAISGAPAVITGMKLGTGSTAVAKTGAGAALVTYLSGSNKALDGGYPTSSLQSGSRQITYRRTYAAGEATTASAITEAVLVNDTITTDATSVAANTISRVIVAGVGSKGASDTLTVTWNHLLTGA